MRNLAHGGLWPCPVRCGKLEGFPSADGQSQALISSTSDTEEWVARDS